MSLRPYQLKAVNDIKHLYARNVKRILLHMATGAGKTVVFCDIIKKAALKGTKTIVTVHGVKLVDQASKRLTREGVPHGFIQGNNTRDIHHDVLVTSIDTLFARKFSPEADFVVVDECHLARGKKFQWFLDQYKDKYILGVSATPHLKEGLRHIADDIVYPISIQELIEQKFLVPMRYFAPSEPDLSRISIKRGDYDETEVSEEMSKPKIRSDIVKSWQKYGENRPTLMFCVNVKHSKMMVDEFLSVGIPAAHVDASTPLPERDKLIDSLCAGEIKILSNVGILCTGVDIPPLSCIISARPTRSYNLWIQQLGRGTRPFTDKSDCIILDNASNTVEHGFIENEKIAEMDPKKSRRKKKKEASELPKLVTCKSCFAIYAHPGVGKPLVCPACGFQASKEDQTKYERKFDMIEVKKNEWEFFLENMLSLAKRRGYKKGFIFHRIKEKYGEDIANIAWTRIKHLKKWEVTTTKPSSEKFSLSTGRANMSGYGKTTPDKLG